MNDDFTFLIFTYHNVFHSLLASFRLRKWRLLALVSSDVDVTCVFSFRSAFPTQRRWVMMKTNFQPKIGLKQPNVLTQRSQPSIWVEKITQRFLECTVIAKNIGTLAILSENATLLSENCCSCKCFGTHILIFFVCIGTTQKNRRKVKSDTIPHRTQKMHWTKLLDAFSQLLF